MRLTVLNVAYSLALTGPDAVGGAEQILTQLDAALTRAGHRSLVVACEASTAAGTLIPTPTYPDRFDDEARRVAWDRHGAAVAAAIDRWPVDVVHMHGFDFHRYLPPPGPPVLVTLHLPPAWYPPEVFALERPRTYLHCVSASQQAACPARALLLPAIENGVPSGPAVAAVGRDAFVLALGRICPEKGFHIALDAAKRADLDLLLAGQLFPYAEHQRYFEQEIAPRLDDRRRFIGPVGRQEKQRLLSTARCLLAPSLAPETSSLVAMEAMACGTPVIAFPAGALAEIVEHGRTGFLVRDAREMAEAIDAVRDIDPLDCRDAAATRFSLDRMTARYLALYRSLAGDSPPILRPRPGAARRDECWT